MFFKLIVTFCAFVGAFLIAAIASSQGMFANNVLLTLDSGYQITKVFVIACCVALLAFRLRAAE